MKATRIIPLCFALAAMLFLPVSTCRGGRCVEYYWFPIAANHGHIVFVQLLVNVAVAVIVGVLVARIPTRRVSARLRGVPKRVWIALCVPVLLVTGILIIVDAQKKAEANEKRAYEWARRANVAYKEWAQHYRNSALGEARLAATNWRVALRFARANQVEMDVTQILATAETATAAPSSNSL